MGVQDVPEPFQNAACFELVKQSAFMIDFGRILGGIWRPEAASRTKLAGIKTIVGEILGFRIGQIPF